MHLTTTHFFKFKKHLECPIQICNTGYRIQIKMLETKKKIMCETHSTLDVTKRRLKKTREPITEQQTEETRAEAPSFSNVPI